MAGEGSFTMEDRETVAIREIREQVGDSSVLVLVSGGVDSSVCAALLNRALGPERVVAMHIDNGFMRLEESLKVAVSLERLGLPLRVNDASETFYSATTTCAKKSPTGAGAKVSYETKPLRDCVAPEEKRQIIGDTFLRVSQLRGSTILRYDAKTMYLPPLFLMLFSGRTVYCLGVDCRNRHGQTSPGPGQDLSRTRHIAARPHRKRIALGKVGCFFRGPLPILAAAAAAAAAAPTAAAAAPAPALLGILLPHGRTPILLWAANGPTNWMPHERLPAFPHSSSRGVHPELSAGRSSGADAIKTHHNDTALVRELRAKGRVIEPLKDYHKDEVRR